MTVLIAGAGIAGLTLGLTLHQIGVPFRILESVRELRPLGVGINLQPNAVRELLDLGLGDDLDRIGVRTRQYGFYSKTGRTIWEEPRGLAAGYRWPQYSIHRGRLQMLLAKRLVERAAPFDRALEAVGGWDGIVRSAKELKEFEPELWEQFAACVRWVRPKRGRYSEVRIGDGGHILKLAERLGLGSATVLRRRDAAIREIARGAA